MIQRGIGDARPLWVAMIPKIKEFVRDEFSGANPSNWPALTPKYRHQKAKQGFPHWIGVRTGNMKKAAGENAQIQLFHNKMEWRLNTGMTPTKSGKPYAAYFNEGTSNMPARPIFKSTQRRVNTFLRTDIKNMEGESRSSFTFAWLQNALGDYRR